MELDVSVGNDFLSIPLDNPYQLDIESIAGKIRDFFESKGIRLNSLDIKGLLPLMVKGIAGCEAGCPANALDLVSQGFEKFDLAYIEGGILTAKTVIPDGKLLSIKMFPDF